MDTLLMCWKIVLTASLVTAALFVGVKAVKFNSRREIPQIVRDKSHEAANEATKLKASLRRIARSDDPIGELVKAMSGDSDDLERNN